MDLIKSGIACKQDDDNFHMRDEDTGANEEFQAELVYYNDYLMRGIVPYISIFKDRVNLELSSRRLKHLSSKSNYIGLNVENSVLDMTFMGLDSQISMNIAGNRVDLPILVSTGRISADAEFATQPVDSIRIINAVFARCRRQISQLKLGGISDCDRRLGYIPDHQLIITRDLSDCLEQLISARSLVLRNCCLTPPVIDQWCNDKSALIRGLTSLCLHSIWFDNAPDIEKLGGLLSQNLKRLSISDCASKAILLFTKRLMSIGNTLERIYVSIDHSTFFSVPNAVSVFKLLSATVKEIHVCIVISVYHGPGHRALLNFLPCLSSFDRITFLELDIGWTGRYRHITRISQLLHNLVNLSQLKTLRLTGRPLSYNTVQLWDALIEVLPRVSPRMTEIAIHGVPRNLQPEQLDAFISALPQELKAFSFAQSCHFSNQHVYSLVKRCPELELLCFRGLKDVSNEGIIYAIRSLCQLRMFGMVWMGPADSSVYHALLERKGSRKIEAVIIGGNKEHPSRDVTSLLNASYASVSCTGVQCPWREFEYYVWTRRSAYIRLQQFSTFADCAECGKDLLTYTDDDFY